MMLLFLIDVSPPMAAAAPLAKPQHLSHNNEKRKNEKPPDFCLLDLAKIAVDSLAKGCRWNKGDQFLLMTTAGGPEAVLCRWGDGPAHFEAQLKSLRMPKDEVEDGSAQGSSSGSSAQLGPALRSGFYLMNRHRMLSGVDNWGRGRLPWQVDVGALILITHNTPAALQEGAPPEVPAELRNEKLFRDCADRAPGAPPLSVAPMPGEDLSVTPYRWEQRMHALVLTGEESLGSTARGRALSQLCEATGGQARGCYGLAGVRSGTEALVHRLQQAGPAVCLVPLPPRAVIVPATGRLRQPSAGDAQEMEADTGLLGSSTADAESASPFKPLCDSKDESSKPVRGILTMRRGTASWPLPEAGVAIEGLVDRARDDLPPLRTGQPEVFYKVPADASSDPTVKAAAAAARLGIAMDEYEVEWCAGNAPSAATAFYSSRATTVTPARMPKDAKWPLFARAVPSPLQLAGSAGGAVPPTFVPWAFLQGHRLVGRGTLTVLPYNFPWLVHLLLQIEQLLILNASQAAAAALPGAAGDKTNTVASLTPEWRNDFKTYLTAVPLYYHAALKRALKPMGLHLLVQDQAIERPLPQRVHAHLNSLKDAVRAELESAHASTAPLRTTSTPATHGSHGSRAQQDLEAGLEALLCVPPGQLLEHFERMRRGLFGGGMGVTVTGLFSTHAARAPCGASQSVPRGTSHSTPGGASLLAEVSQSLAPARSVHDMSNYIALLLSREPLRDPDVRNDDYREAATPQEVMQRKVAVDFGNPFRQQRRGGGGRSLSSSGRGGGGGAISEGLADMALDEAADEAAILLPHEGDVAAADAALTPPRTPLHAPLSLAPPSEGEGAEGDSMAVDAPNLLNLEAGAAAAEATEAAAAAAAKRKRAPEAGAPPVGASAAGISNLVSSLHSKRLRKFVSESALRRKAVLDAKRAAAAAAAPPLALLELPSTEAPPAAAPAAAGAAAAEAAAPAAAAATATAKPAARPPPPPPPAAGQQQQKQMAKQPLQVKPPPQQQAVQRPPPPPPAAKPKSTEPPQQPAAAAAAPAAVSPLGAGAAALPLKEALSLGGGPASPFKSPFAPAGGFSPFTPPGSPVTRATPAVAGGGGSGGSGSAAALQAPAAAAAAAAPAAAHPPAAAKPPAAAAAPAHRPPPPQQQRLPPPLQQQQQRPQQVQRPPPPQQQQQAPQPAAAAAAQGQLQPRDYVLPPGWTVQRSSKQQREYFFNSTTGKSLWTPPPGSVPKQRPAQQPQGGESGN